MSEHVDKTGTSIYEPVSFAAVADEAVNVLAFAEGLAHDDFATLAQGYAIHFALWGDKPLDFSTSHEGSIAARMAKVPAAGIYPAAPCQLALVLSDGAHTTDDARSALRGSLLPDGVDDLSGWGCDRSYIGLAVRTAQLVLLALYNQPMLELIVSSRPLGARMALLRRLTRQ